MPQWLYQFGRSPVLSAVELAAVFQRDFRRVPAAVVSREFLIADALGADPAQAIGRLGGIPKIAEVLQTGRWPDQGKLAHVLADTVAQASAGERKTFGVSLLPAQHVHRANKLGLAVKRRLLEQGFRARYVSSDKQPLSSVTVEREGLLGDGVELTVAASGDEQAIARTVAIQPFAALSKRDYGRPNRDPVSGLLPPKLAIIMLNLSGLGPESIVLDPFCGSGTVLQEAELMGFRHLIGSDVSEQAVHASRDNLRWLRDAYGAKADDVTLKLWPMPFKQLPGKLGAESVDGIVTEPFLGPPIRRSTNPKVITNAVGDLSRLYNDFLATARVLLKRGGALVTVVPKFRTGKQTFRDLHLRTEGFAEPELVPASWGVPKRALTYGRPDQHVYRRILVLRRK
ncbi:MAG: hypothetical protein HYZ09_01480 [Candidatus Kerfeldbacteria bacterium]|nr:hypothetical protein [Candidatus Kerfeldbacteria bacterium]